MLCTIRRNLLFPPHDHVLPGLSPHENITRSINELITALKYPHTASPTNTFGNEQTQVLIQLSKIIQLALPEQLPILTIPTMICWSGLPALPLPSVPTAPPLPRVLTTHPFQGFHLLPHLQGFKYPSSHQCSSPRHKPHLRTSPLLRPCLVKHAILPSHLPENLTNTS